MFNVFPTMVDVVIAIVYFVAAFDYIFGIVVFLTMAAYLGKCIDVLVVLSVQNMNFILSMNWNNCYYL